MLGARARALFDGRYAPSLDDVAALAEPVLQHRMALSFAARADGMTVRDVIAGCQGRLGWMARRSVEARSATGPRLATRGQGRGRARSARPAGRGAARRQHRDRRLARPPQRGRGETFWQFRPYVDGEATPRIDWRRSARDEHTYVREKEWEAAHMIWLWADLSPSMVFRSRAGDGLQGTRALVLLACARRAAVAQRRARRLPRRQRSDLGAQRRRAARRALVHAAPAPAKPDLARSAASPTSSSPAISSTRSPRPWRARRARRARRPRPPDPGRRPGRGDLPLYRPHRIPRPRDRRQATAGRAEHLATTTATLYLGAPAGLAACCAPRLDLHRPPHRPAGHRAAARVHFALSTDGFSAARTRSMSSLPFASPFPPILFALVALPVIWWLLRLTPPKPQTGGLPAAADPRARAQERRRRRRRARGG